jgi:hypothetical protein
MIPGSANALLLKSAAADTGYNIERSLRFNSSDSAYLSRTPASAGNRKTWTWAGWVKLGVVGGYVFGCDNVRNSTQSLYLSFGESISVLSWGFFWRTTASVYRDPSAWYHVVFSIDTTQGTANNRIRIYVNGIELTAFSTLNNPTQNADLGINQQASHRIGDYGGGSYFSGYLADVHFIDGQALDPTSFGEFDDNGIWQPIEYTGTYGTNGFHLDFSDNSTAAALGTDTSGNGNTWTVNNISVTAGAGNDSLVDVPTNGTETDTGVGGQVRGNYATLNPLALTAHTLANGNLDVSSSAIGIAVGTVAMSTGKWYWEITLNTVSANVSPVFGYINQSFNTATAGTTYLGIGANAGGVRRDNGQAFQNNTSTSYTGAAGFSAGDVAMVAFDADAKKMWVGKNGTWYNSGAPASGTGNIPLTITGTTFFPAFNTYGNSWSVNFGQRPFAYTAPSGFKALCTANLPAPVVTKPSEYFDVKLYTGNGSTQTISGLEFPPDLVWVKQRNTTRNHQLVDTVRGATKDLRSNTTGAETTTATGLTAFTSDGFSLGSDTGYNENAGTYSAWTWDAGSSTVTNTDGSITSSVRANPSAGFSIVTYTGTGSNATVGHGLGVAPSFIITKTRSGGAFNGVVSWSTYHVAIGADGLLFLNGTNPKITTALYWNNTAPTSSVFSVGAGDSYAPGASGFSQVAYCFAPVAGYSSFGSYTGNGSADGAFVYTGFRPRYAIFKSTTTATGWFIWDSATNSINVMTKYLAAHSSDAEGTYTGVDFLSNGFKFRSSSGSDGFNQSGQTYIYAAFAESPFQYARAR